MSSVTLYFQVTKIVIIQLLNCQNCNQCLKGHKSLGLLIECILLMYLSLSLSFSLSLSLSLSMYLSLSLSFFGQVMSPQYSDQMSQRSKVSRIAH